MNGESSPQVQDPSVLILASEVLFPHFLAESTLARLGGIARWRLSTIREDCPELRGLLASSDALVTTWHSPFLRLDMLGSPRRVRLIAHCGGEVKSRMERSVVECVTVTNAPDAMANPVAEMALALVLSLVRRLPQYERQMRTGGNVDNRVTSESETLSGRTVGVVGFGRIGRELARLLRPFPIELLAHDPYCPAEAFPAAGAEPVPLDGLLQRSSVVVLAAGLTDETRGMLNARTLARLPDGAFLVNVGRGGLVDMEALVRELRTGRISAALDVTDPLEPLPEGHELRDMQNVLLTPHVAAGGIEVRRAMGAAAIEAVAAFLAGRPPANIVTPAMLDHMT
jgi:phosphoglycerate dehydrogenase-like enzyme